MLELHHYFFVPTRCQSKAAEQSIMLSIVLQSEEAERAVSEEEMEAAALTWSKGLTAGPSPHERQHPV